MRAELYKKIQTGQKIEDLIASLQGIPVAGRKVQSSVDARARPYLDHVVAGFTDGPPSSNVIAVISGKDPAGALWRRFSLTRKGPWLAEIDVFPTPFPNEIDPLSPGIPPGASRPAR